MEEAVIIGGGPAGASMALRLARAGRSVLLIEREAGPHDKVCGEFLSFEAATYLAELGLDAHALGAVPITGVEVLHGHRRASAPLPFQALSLSRRIMDEALLAQATAWGARVQRGRRVTRLERHEGTWRITLDDGSLIETEQTILATGKHDLRDWKRPSGRQADLIGFKQHWSLADGSGELIARRVELHLFDGGYAGLEPVDGDRANLCLVVRKRAFDAAGRNWTSLLTRLLIESPSLRERLEGGRPSTERALAIASIPYGHVRSRSDGLWRLGDQAAVIPSFAGEGMSIALHSARLAADAWLAGKTAQTYQRALAHDVGAQVSRATWLSRALVRPWGQAAIFGVIGGAPSLLRAAAMATRIPTIALQRPQAGGASPAVLGALLPA